MNHEPDCCDADIESILTTVEAAVGRVGEIDLIIFPELSLTDEAIQRFRQCLAEREFQAKPPLILSGVHVPSQETSLGHNIAALYEEHGLVAEQHKHHRWALDVAQLRDYRLAQSLSPERVWWEATSIRPRELVIYEWDKKLAFVPLICEDLARQEPIPPVIRALGPSLVIALLFDGSQVSPRWPSRFAAVLADDPGSAVLTFTCLGAVRLSDPPGYPTNGEVAMWVDPGSTSPRVIRSQTSSSNPAGGVVLKVEVRENNLDSHGLTAADGRRNRAQRARLYLGDWFVV